MITISNIKCPRNKPINVKDLCEKWLKRLEETKSEQLNRGAGDDLTLWANVRKRDVKIITLPSEPVILPLGKHTLRQ